MVAHLVWDQGVAGSNPVTPTTLRIVYLLTGRALGKLKIVIRGVAQLVAHLVWDQGVAGSNPVTPTKISQGRILERFFYGLTLALSKRGPKNSYVVLGEYSPHLNRRGDKRMWV